MGEGTGAPLLHRRQRHDSRNTEFPVKITRFSAAPPSVFMAGYDKMMGMGSTHTEMDDDSLDDLPGAKVWVRVRTVRWRDSYCTIG